MRDSARVWSVAVCAGVATLVAVVTWDHAHSSFANLVATVICTVIGGLLGWAFLFIDQILEVRRRK